MSLKLSFLGQALCNIFGVFRLTRDHAIESLCANFSFCLYRSLSFSFEYMVRLENFGVVKYRLKCLVFISSTFSVFHPFIESFIDEFTGSVFTNITRLEARKKTNSS